MTLASALLYSVRCRRCCWLLHSSLAEISYYAEAAATASAAAAAAMAENTRAHAQTSSDCQMDTQRTNVAVAKSIVAVASNEMVLTYINRRAMLISAKPASGAQASF